MAAMTPTFLVFTGLCFVVVKTLEHDCPQGSIFHTPSNKCVSCSAFCNPPKNSTKSIEYCINNCPDTVVQTVLRYIERNNTYWRDDVTVKCAMHSTDNRCFWGYVVAVALVVVVLLLIAAFVFLVYGSKYTGYTLKLMRVVDQLGDYDDVPNPMTNGQTRPTSSSAQSDTIPVNNINQQTEHEDGNNVEEGLQTTGFISVERGQRLGLRASPSTSNTDVNRSDDTHEKVYDDSDVFTPLNVSHAAAHESDDTTSLPARGPILCSEPPVARTPLSSQYPAVAVSSQYPAVAVSCPNASVHNVDPLCRCPADRKREDCPTCTSGDICPAFDCCRHGPNNSSLCVGMDTINATDTNGSTAQIGLGPDIVNLRPDSEN